VDSPQNIIQTKKLIKKAFMHQIEGLGFSLLEILSPCPTDWGLSPAQSIEWIRSAMMDVFKLGVLKDTWKDGR
jgi:2-oxoglutarate ferredoxin oxidoreductase subunit beta